MKTIPLKDRRFVYMSKDFIISQCNKCQNYFKDELKIICKAFPNGIPNEILTGEFDHTKPYKGDNGLRFEPIKEKAKA